MWTATTSPSTSQVSRFSPAAVLSWTIWVSRHSKFTGLSRTLGAATRRLGACVRPAASNSSRPRGKSAEVRFICWARGAVARFQTNSPVSWILATVSFQPMDENQRREYPDRLDERDDAARHVDDQPASVDPWRPRGTLPIAVC